MSSGRYHPELYDPEQRAKHESKHAQRKKIYRRLNSYRMEILIELLLIAGCMVLGVAFQLKMMLTVTLFCVAAAIPDFVTAILVRRDDPDPKHGKTLMYFFIAYGFLRTATLGIGVFTASMLAFVFFPAFGGLADVGAITGLMVTMGVFVVVFPITLMGVWHGYSLPGGVFFCREFTRLRRRGEFSQLDPETLDPARSLKILGAGSAISTAVFSVAAVLLLTAVLNPANRLSDTAQLLVVGVLLAQLVIPLTWYIFFCVKFAEPWQTDADEAEEVVPLSPDEIQYLS